MRDEAGEKGGWDTELQVITRVEEKALRTAFGLLTQGLTIYLYTCNKCTQLAFCPLFRSHPDTALSWGRELRQGCWALLLQV